MTAVFCKVQPAIQNQQLPIEPRTVDFLMIPILFWNIVAKNLKFSGNVHNHRCSSDEQKFPDECHAIDKWPADDFRIVSLPAMCSPIHRANRRNPQKFASQTGYIGWPTNSMHFSARCTFSLCPIALPSLWYTCTLVRQTHLCSLRTGRNSLGNHLIHWKLRSAKQMLSVKNRNIIFLLLLNNKIFFFSK